MRSSHHIALALAQTRVADAQTAATQTTATMSRRQRRRRALAVLVAGTAAIAAGAPTDAPAQALHDVGITANPHADATPSHDLRGRAKTSSLAGTTSTSPQVVAAEHALAMRSQGHGQHQHGSDLSIVPSSAQTAPVASARVSHTADGGFDWVDAGIGAGVSAALLLGAAGVASVRRRPTLPAN
jgi:hypothetical protein